MVTAAINSDQPERVRGPGRDPCDRAGLPRRSRDTPSLWRELADPPLHLLVDGEGRIAALFGAGQDAINRLAAQVQSWLEEMDPLGKTRFAKTNPAGLALQWTEPPG